MRHSAALLCALALGVPVVRAQMPLLGARATEAKVGIKIFSPAGSVRITAWDKDSLIVRGRVARGEHFYLSGDHKGIKLGIMQHTDDAMPAPSTFEIMVPRGSSVSVKTVTADVTASGVSGWFYSVSGKLALDGTARDVDAQTIDGDIMLALTAPVVRAQTGDGKITMRGAPEDVDLSTVGGALDVETPFIVRGRFASVAGEIRFTGAPVAGGVLDFTNHSGAVVMVMPRDVAGVFELSTIMGTIANGMSAVRAINAPSGQGSSVRITLGGREGAGRVTVRTFLGGIVLRPAN
jgi:hypothetical protein